MLVVPLKFHIKTYKVRHNVRRFAAGLLLLLLGYSNSAFAQQNCEQQKVDKAYQEILYFYFQQNFYQALTHIEVLESKCAQAFKTVTNPGVDPLLLKGGISLAYGLEEQAAEIFDNVLSQAADDKTQTQAWLLLGKAMFQKREDESAAKALSNITLDAANEHLDPLDKDEWIYMQSQLYAAQNADTKADPNASPNQATDSSYWLEELSGNSIYRQYVIYNKGLAQLQNGQIDSAIATLNTVGDENTGFFPDFFSGWFGPLRTEHDEELKALKDRANLTLGYAHLKNQQTLESLNAFKRVRLDSLDTNSAMLGYGWAAAQREEYQIAVSVWKQLQDMPYSNEFVMESFLASAYAYEQAFAPTQAIENLNKGLARYAREVRFLTQSLNQVDDNFFLELGKTDNWSEAIPEHLEEIMLSNDFRSQLGWLSETIQINQDFQQWQDRLDVFDAMLDERQQENRLRTEKLKNDNTLNKLSELVARRDRIQQQINQAKDDHQILASEEEIAWLTRLDRAVNRHEAIVQKRAELSQQALSESYAERLKRINGILIWKAAESHAGRQWQATKALAELDKIVLKTSAQQSLLQSALNRPPEYQEQRNRIANLREQLQTKVALNKQSQRALLGSLQSLFSRKLNAQLAQLQSYQIQAQLAIVRLNDKAYRKAQAEEQQGGRQ